MELITNYIGYEEERDFSFHGAPPPKKKSSKGYGPFFFFFFAPFASIFISQATMKVQFSISNRIRVEPEKKKVRNAENCRWKIVDTNHER